MATTDVSLQKESRDRYLTYALSVVSGRALPDLRDGLKPVQRRILFAMHKLGLKPSASHRKSAAVVGEVLARFHPHGDVACYEAMVRMAQDFTLRYPLVDGQGNFGSLDGDSPAAYRYTEAKLKEIAIEVLGEIDEETVPYRDNFDATVQEPVVLPSRIPNLLINGASGIAVGMATNIPPHNLRDVVRALLELSKDASLTNSKLTTIIKGPDFPTGCQILNSREELVEIYETGRGLIRMRGEYQLEEGKRGKTSIIITSIPYGVNKSQLVEKIADLIVNKKIPQLVDVRDESTDKVRVVLELAGGADAGLAMAFIFKHTALESNFSANLTALVPTENGACKPELCSLKDLLHHFIVFREDVVKKRLVFERKNLLARIHILEGFKKIFDRLDEALKIVRSSDGRGDAAEKLRVKFKLSEEQAYSIVDLRVYQLSKTDIVKILEELAEKKKRVGQIEKILASKKEISGIMRADLEKVAELYGDNRRCDIVKNHVDVEVDESCFVVDEDVFAIVTNDGWIKRIRQNNELNSTRLREGDVIARAHPLSTRDLVAFFTNLGSLFVMRVSEFPSSSGYGSPVQSLLKFKDGEVIVESFGIKVGKDAGAKDAKYGQTLKNGDTITLVTRRGVGFALQLAELELTKKNGRRVIKVREGDALAAVSHLGDKMAFFTRQGCGLIIKGSEILEREAAAMGVNLMGVREDDALLACLPVSRGARFTLTLESGRSKEITSADMAGGHRGLKGKKVITQGQIKAVRELMNEHGQISLL